jgi:uncharacterized damage-inducible protein DinB
VRVLPLGAEKESLYASLDRHRDVLLWKLDGLDAEQLRRPMVPSGTNLIGVVKHLASIEFKWFCRTFGRASDEISYDESDPDAEMRAGPGETAAGIIAYYGRARVAADAVIAELDLGATGTAWSGETVSLRYVLIHMIEETLRHAGQLDILRELIDGRIGYLPS